jgi:hypothetical protein
MVRQSHLSISYPSPDTHIYLDSGGKITQEIRPPLDNAVRWHIAYAGNGTF